MKHEDRHYWEDNVASKNFSAARRGAAALCGQGDSWGCTMAGYGFQTSLGGEKDDGKAVEFAKRVRLRGDGSLRSSGEVF
jgi:hypothetical protein